MTEVYRATLFWWPAIFRAILLSLVAASAVFLAQSAELTGEEIAKFGWWEWIKFGVPVVVALFNNTISFLDQTMGKLRTESETQIWKAGETV